MFFGQSLVKKPKHEKQRRKTLLSIDDFPAIAILDLLHHDRLKAVESIAALAFVAFLECEDVFKKLLDLLLSPPKTALVRWDEELIAKQIVHRLQANGCVAHERIL